MLTNIFANNQEWFYYLSKSNSQESLEETLTTLKTYNDLASFHNLLETNQLFALPLTSLFEDTSTLGDIKKTLDELTNEASSNLATASSAPSLSNQTTNKYANSKLTPAPPLSSTQSKSTTSAKATTTNTSPPSIQMIFIVTAKNVNSLNEISNASSTTYQEFSRPRASAYVPLGFDNLMSLESQDVESMNNIHGSSFIPMNSKKNKANDTGTGKRII